MTMNNYRSIIRAELAANSRGKQQYVERDYSNYTCKSSSAWGEAPDADFFVSDDEDDMECGFFSSTEEDDDMACMFFN